MTAKHAAHAARNAGPQALAFAPCTGLPVMLVGSLQPSACRVSMPQGMPCQRRSMAIARLEIHR